MMMREEEILPEIYRNARVVQGMYNQSQDTLVEALIANQSVTLDRKSIRSTVREVFSRNKLETSPLHETKLSCGLRHRFRRWKNNSDKNNHRKSGSSSSSRDTANTHKTNNANLNNNKDKVQGADADRETQETYLPTIGEPFGSNENMEWGSTRRCSLSLLASQEIEELSIVSSVEDTTEGKTKRSVRKSKMHKLRGFRFKLHKRLRPTLTEKYLGSSENVERCLQDMDSIPFELMAPCTASTTDALRNKKAWEMISSNASTVVPASSYCDKELSGITVNYRPSATDTTSTPLIDSRVGGRL